ncbi:hypothetical protein BSKO_00304 [Bryopsis sp. KO-2023]|nr:hypothetical protein BSKO_00304 [Bryopsis sp. KO-2023]
MDMVQGKYAWEIASGWQWCAVAEASVSSSGCVSRRLAILQLPVNEFGQLASVRSFTLFFLFSQLVLKKLPASRLVVFVASQVAFAQSEVKAITRALRDAKICVSIVTICPKQELGPELCKTLENMITSLNSDGSAPCGATHSSSLFHVNCELEIEEVVEFVKSNRQGMEMDQAASIEASCNTANCGGVNFSSLIVGGSIANPPYKSLLEVQAGRMIGQKVDEDRVSMEAMLGGDEEEWLESGNFWNSKFGQRTDGVEEIGAHWNHSTIDCFRGLQFQWECNDVLRSSQVSAHHKPIHLVADPAKGHLAFTQTSDGTGKMRLLWWKSSKTTAKDVGPAQNLFTASSPSGDEGALPNPDLDIETIPSKCVFKAAENSDNRVLVLECQQYECLFVIGNAQRMRIQYDWLWFKESSEAEDALSQNLVLEQIQDTLAQLSDSRFERETERRRRRVGIVKSKDEGPSEASEAIPLVGMPNDGQESQQDDSLMFDLD